MIELLAPAGSEECFFAAVNNGADAVYLGLSSFSARKNAANFNEENIGYFVSYAHAVGVKVYVALNTIVKDCELSDFIKTAGIALGAGADALIIQDIFLGKVLKEVYPDCVIHLSTQAGVNNPGGAKLAKEYGFSRVILARETEIGEIKKITKEIETEIFVHGALCSSFSGHCYLSSFIGGNSGNRGLCKQPCRKKYTIETKTSGGKYSFSLADLKLDDKINEIILSGVASVKIEGRMRTKEYVAASVRLYRNAIDNNFPVDLSEIKRTFNRGNYTGGYLFGTDKNIISDKIQNHCGEYFGKVKKIYGDKIIIGAERIPNENDGFKIVRNGFETGNAVCLAKGRELAFRGDVRVGDEVMITRDTLLSATLDNVPEKRKKIKVEAYFSEGEKPRLVANGITVEDENILEQAKTSPLTKEQIEDNLHKTDKYPFETEPYINVKGNPFIVKSKLNKIRSELYAKLFTQDVKVLKIADKHFDFSTNCIPSYNGVIQSDSYVNVPENFAFVLRPVSYDNMENIKNILGKVCADKFLFVPSFLPEKDEERIKELLKLFDGIYADGLSGISLWKNSGKKIIVGSGLNSFNSVDFYYFNKLGIRDAVYSKELSKREVDSIKTKGYLFTFGRVKLAEFLYCPFKRECTTCKRGNTFSVTDETGHGFILSRYKINGRCRFELLNGDILKFAKNDYNFFNFTGFSEKEIQEILNGEDFSDGKYRFTNGNLKRGIL